jgi:hypothetical protein
MISSHRVPASCAQRQSSSRKLARHADASICVVLTPGAGSTCATRSVRTPSTSVWSRTPTPEYCQTSEVGVLGQKVDNFSSPRRAFCPDCGVPACRVFGDSGCTQFTAGIRKMLRCNKPESSEVQQMMTLACYTATFFPGAIHSTTPHFFIYSNVVS